jgi:hypothetical protein
MANTKVPIELSSTPGIVDNSTATAITIDASENVGIGVSTPALGLSVYKQSDTSFTNLPANIYSYDSTAMAAGVGGGIWFGGRHVTGSESATTFAAISGIKANGTSTNTAGALTFGVRDSSGGVAIERMRIDSAGNVGVSVTPKAWSVYNAIQIGEGALAGGEATAYGTSLSSNAYYDGSWKYLTTDEAAEYKMSNGVHAFRVAASGTADSAISWTTAATIDNSGNFLVGKTALNIGLVGQEFRAGSSSYLTVNGDTVLGLNRLSSDGTVLEIRKDSTVVGSIGANGGVVYVSGAVAGGLKYSNYNATNASIFPCTTTGAIADAVHDLGYSGSRFRDIYRSGSTISTSDRNMKQDIRDLTDAERNVAVVAKGLLKAFRFINRVEEENDSAKIHFGIIAQDLAAAFEAEGLDANDYQVYRSDIFTDEDGKEQVRLGVCYENLLAFIIAAI